MSDTESISASLAHPTMGGKSLQSLERPRYKSWRKKYRKMRVAYDTAFEENRRLFREEAKLESTARRLREELDGLREVCLDLNQTPSIPPHLRFDVSLSRNRAQPDVQQVVKDDITPEQGNDLITHYIALVRSGQCPPLDLHVVREQVEQVLAKREVEPLRALEERIPHDYAGNLEDLPEDVKGEEGGVGWLSLEQERDYLRRLDAKVDRGAYGMADDGGVAGEEKSLGEMTSREFERMLDIKNPVSQHNWLRLHGKEKVHHGAGLEADDNESLASHEPKPPPKKHSKKELAKKVGDRALERAREGFSPGAGSGEDELAHGPDDISLRLGASGGRKKAKDPDGTYRVKGGKSGVAGTKGKRKRSGEDMGTGSVKKVKAERLATPGTGAE